MTLSGPACDEELAERLDRAAVEVMAINRLTDTEPVDVARAYEVQRVLIARRIARGDRRVGLKMGLTSEAKMAQMGVNEVIWGRLTESMRIPDAGTLSLGGLIHPRIEPEVAFLVDHTPEPGEDLACCVQAVAPALEVIDSRYTGFSFTLPDVIADNTSAARFVIGAWQPVPTDLDRLAVRLEIDDQTVHTGSTSAILGDPRRAFAEAVRLGGRAGESLGAGDVVLAGAATAAVPLTPGTRVRAVVDGLGHATVTAVA